MTPTAVDQYFLEEGIASAAIERYHLEQLWRRLWLSQRSEKKRKCRKNRRLPFKTVVQRLRDSGEITQPQYRRLVNTYNRLSKLVHMTRPEDL